MLLQIHSSKCLAKKLKMEEQWGWGGGVGGGENHRENPSMMKWLVKTSTYPNPNTFITKDPLNFVQ